MRSNSTFNEEDLPIVGHLSQDLTNGNAEKVGDQLELASPVEGILNGCEAYICKMNNSADGEPGTSIILQQEHCHLMPGQCSRHRPFSSFRILRGIMCIIILLSTAFMMLVYLAPVAAVLLRLFSMRYSRKMTSFFFSKWLSLWPFLFEKINKTKVVWSGEIVPPGERVLLICNHRTEVDWMYLWNFAIRKGRLGYIKYMLKSSLMKLPIFGWGFHILDFIPVKRKWEHDELLIRQMLSTFVDSLDPLWLAIFPEGTDYTEQKCLRNQKYAKENGLPILENVLLPKTKGFTICLEVLRNSLDAVYDVTIGYKHRCPSFMDNVFGVDPSEVHMHVHRIPLDGIPTSEVDATAWLIKLFQQKDNLLSDFHAKGHFPHQTVEVDVSVFRCLVNFAFVIILTSLCTFLTYSSPWFRFYVTLSCAYLASATHFNIRPVPLLGGKKYTL